MNAGLGEPYYGLGVLFDDEGEKERAKKLFQTALSADPSFVEARVAIRKLDAQKVTGPGNWWFWWFNPDSSRWRKLLGLVSIAFLLLVVTRLGYDAYAGIDAPTSVFGIAGVIVLILVLPSVSQLTAGPVSLQLNPATVGQKV